MSDVIGLLAALISTMVIGHVWLDPHWHQCACGHAWRHHGVNSNGLRSTAQHTCRECGAEVWLRSCNRPKRNGKIQASR